MIESYNQLPLGKYMEICDICNDESLEDIERQASILSVLTDTDMDTLLNLPIMEYKALSAKAKFLEEALPTTKGRIGQNYKLGNWNLVATTAIGKMTTAQYVDFQTFSKDAIHHLPELVSVFLVPKGFKYNDGYDIVELQEAIRQGLPVTDCNRMIAFFLTRLSNSIKAMLIYSRFQIKKIRNKEERERMMTRWMAAVENLDKSGDGLQMLMQLQKPADAVGMMSGK